MANAARQVAGKAPEAVRSVHAHRDISKTAAGYRANYVRREDQAMSRTRQARTMDGNPKSSTAMPGL